MSPAEPDRSGRGFRILFFFQDWCAGFHAHGFPTFVRLTEELHEKGVGLAAIQTVFEGSDVNILGRLRDNQRRYGLLVPFGHAPTSDGAVPAIMEAVPFRGNTVVRCHRSR